MSVTREQVLALAPDAASAKAAAGLCTESKWATLGADGDAVWGECKGSGAKPYQTQVELAGLASKCSCPSRKFPCKHGLALLLLHAQGAPGFSAATRPDWVDQWLQSRHERTVRKEQAAEKKPVDPAAQAAAAARREGGRWQRIEAGCADLERWIADQFRRGLAQGRADRLRDGRAMAARMVDAQAPALAHRLGDALDALEASRHEDAAERFGLLQLITLAVARRDALGAPRLADLRAALGWTHDREDVTAHGDLVRDEWTVLGQCFDTRDERLVERRVWLHGRASSRFALVQDFAYGGQGWDSQWFEGQAQQAELAFHPGTVPLRAVVVSQGPAAGGAWPGLGVPEAVDCVSEAFARNPWLAAAPLPLADATFHRAAAGWRVDTAAGDLAVATSDDAGWALLATTGGRSVRLFGEWDGRALRPLTVHAPAAARADTEIAA